MKTNFLRATLAMILCSSAVCGWGQDEYIINEDFSELYISGSTRTCGEWTLSEGCVKGLNIVESNVALRIENIKVGGVSYIGYANTGKLNCFGDVYLTFDYARGSTRNTTINVSIEGGGSFNDFIENKSIPITSGNQRENFHKASYTIINVTENTYIKFSESAVDHTFVIDNVKVSKIPVISLVESTDNDNSIEDNDEKLVRVETTRTLTGGIWNTLCLPFDVTMETMVQALGDDQDIKMRTFSSYENKEMTFIEATEVPAGTPFLIKLNTTVKNPTFHGVTVKSETAKAVESNGVSFVGTYSPVDLATDGTELFITKNNTLAIPAATTNTMNGMRAYIKVPDNFNPSATRLAIDEPTAIATFNADKPDHSAAAVVYDLNGRHASHPGHGLYIVDGRLTFVKQ